jgi:CheY-like chemotaxis protein
MKTVLVLEDEPSVLKDLRRLLEQYCPIEAATPEEALLRFIDHDCQIDLLVADLRGARRRVPSRSGIEVALLLRSKLPRLPVILTSGCPAVDWNHRDSTDLERLGSRSVGILQKPLQGQLLLNTVHILTGTAPSVVAGTA